MFAGKRNEKEPKLVVLVVGGYVIGIFVNVSRRRKRTGTFAFPTVVQ